MNTTECANQALYDALRNKFPNYNEEIGRQAVDAVHHSLVDSLGANPDDILPDSNLIEDLNAESIDGLDIGFRIERALDIKFPRENAQLIELIYKSPLSLTEEAYKIKRI